MAAKFWSNVAVAIESALSAAQTIDAITKANPGVVTYQGADPTNGQVALHTIQGMHQLDGRPVRIANVNATPMSSRGSTQRRSRHSHPAHSSW